MTLNRIPEDMRKDVLNLQLYYELTERMKNNDRYYYWESKRRSNLYLKTIGFIKHINNTLDPMGEAIFYMRYVFKYPILKVAQQAGYSKRMIQYKLNDIVMKLEEDLEIYKAIKKMKLDRTVIKSYTSHNTPKKVQ